jgi:hypothetical protein
MRPPGSDLAKIYNPLTVSQGPIETNRYKRLSVWLWAVAGIIIQSLVLPITIDQYPDFFSRNPLLLPAVMLLSILCLLESLLSHPRSRRIYSWASTSWKNGLVASALVSVFSVIVVMVSYKLYVFHANHLRSMVDKPNIGAFFIRGTSPGLVLRALNSATVTHPSYSISAWSLRLRKNIPSFTKTEPAVVIKSDQGVIEPTLDNPNMKAFINRGDQILALVEVTCVECVDEKYYWLFVDYGRMCPTFRGKKEWRNLPLATKPETLCARARRIRHAAAYYD